MKDAFYAGIGSRRTPEATLDLMERIAARLASEGWILRSGHAPGADQAFERGADGRAEIFLPWWSFEQPPPVLGKKFDEPTREAVLLAAEYHPAWDRCSRGARRLHARNMHQVLGWDLDDPVSFVVYWSDGKGGTEQALRIARDRGIPMTNLNDPYSIEWVEDWLSG